MTSKSAPTSVSDASTDGWRSGGSADIGDLAVTAEQLQAGPLRQAVCGNGDPQCEVHRPAEWKVAGADVLDLLAAEALLELPDAAGCQAPHVVGREARAREVGDGGPLQQVVGARIGAGIGHPAVRLDRPVAAGEVKDRGHPLAVEQCEAEAHPPGGREDRPDALVVERLPGD